MTTATQVEYLTETKLRNAVRKVIGFALDGKNEITTRTVKIGVGFKNDFAQASFRNKDNDAVWFEVRFGQFVNSEYYLKQLGEAGFEFTSKVVDTHGARISETLLIRKAK